MVSPSLPGNFDAFWKKIYISNVARKSLSRMTSQNVAQKVFKKQNGKKVSKLYGLPKIRNFRSLKSFSLKNPDSFFHKNFFRIIRILFTRGPKNIGSLSLRLSKSASIDFCPHLNSFFYTPQV